MYRPIPVPLILLPCLLTFVAALPADQNGGIREHGRDRGEDQAAERFSRTMEWPCFRGPHGNGISTATNVPCNWGPDENIKWRAQLPAPGNGPRTAVMQPFASVVSSSERSPERSHSAARSASSGSQ